MNTKLHAVTDSIGRPIRLFITAGQVSDYIGARALCGSLPSVDWLIADLGYDADWFREALRTKGYGPASPAGRPAARLSGTTSAATSAATALRSCSVV
jgi:transposase